MKTLIIGSGPAGAFIGSRLIEGNVDVTFLARPERQRQLITRGVELRTQFGRFRRPVHAVGPEELAGNFDLVIVATRAQDYEHALGLAAKVVGPSTVVLPVIEGVSHLLAPTGSDAPRIIGAVFEGRVTIDADGVMSQRPPLAELTIGAIVKRDASVAAEVAGLLVGRGMRTMLTDNIRARTWERFGFLGSAVALSALTDRPFRDAMPRGHLTGPFSKLLSEARYIGDAAGFPNWTGSPLEYYRAVLLEGRPVLAPAAVADGGRAGDEAAYLLAEMIGLAQRVGVDAPTFKRAWTKVIGAAGSARADVAA